MDAPSTKKGERPAHDAKRYRRGNCLYWRQYYRGPDPLSRLIFHELTGSMERFGEKLHALRTGRQLTLQQLAAMLGYSTHAYLSEIETGKKVPTIAFVLKVARLFTVSTDVLLKDELEIPSQAPHR